MTLQWLDPRDPRHGFPPATHALAQPNGLLAAGGDLSVPRLLAAYSQGVFPWYNADEPILWWSPDPRTIFLPDRIAVSRRLHRTLKAGDFAVTFDHSFADVMNGCAAPRRGQRGTWLSPAMRDAYRRLHAEGYAHSIEVWYRQKLAGGLYGVSLGKAFFGESMFSARPDASKVALVLLARQLAAWGFAMLDGQVGSPHLYRMGAMDVPRQEFLELLAGALHAPTRRGRWSFDIDVPGPVCHMP